MGFIAAYKRLEKLCGEVMNDERKVSAYIDEMYRITDGRFYVPTWSEDLKNLKYYRRLRNQIVHEPGCTEQNMCSAADEKWVTDFYNRILKGTDALALYRKATCKTSHRNTNTSKNRNGIGCLVAVVIMMTLVAVAIFGFVYFLM